MGRDGEIGNLFGQGENVPIDTNGVTPKHERSSPDLPIAQTGENLFFTDFILVCSLTLARTRVV